MKIFIKIKDKNCLPKVDELVEIMWQKGVNLSRVGEQDSLTNGTSLSLSWDKWLDDERWKGHSKFKEYIYFEIESTSSEHKLSIEVDDDACFVDIRAIYKAVEYIAERCNALISMDKGEWLQLNEFKASVDNYLKTSFSDAVEQSLIVV
ncbi:hypothetical protein MM221_16315 [Salipaludibacillus sp. LMS25]|jgi:hypothetical protein|uniref:hypothetical protein n=1 Tax=Salipaludibacillus sp. LMS25 TaxID=2924031 RepID=UPI0020D0B0EC|nr:hypothetical protein [Salipaludibacillus sp. LMS25]UTR14126.1 hypothetical protein MM221_16315 [Salipaludibacillus sp. LMS25]